MSLITTIWNVSASTCLTLAGINMLIWFRDRKAWAYFFFSLMAIGAAGFAYGELHMMRAETPADFGAVLKWAHLAVWLVVVSLIWFVRLYLHAGRLWLAWTVVGLRSLALVLNFVVGKNLNYLEITRLQTISFLGETVHIAKGVPNPWMLVGQASLVACLIFVTDATLTAWKHGDRHRALAVGGSAIIYIFLSTLLAIFVLWGIVPVPLLASLCIMGLVAVMGYELGNDTILAAVLHRKLLEREAGLHEIEERMNLAVDAAGLGIWIRDLVRNEIYTTDKWRVLFGFTHDEPLDFETLVQRVHPIDRDDFQAVVEKAVKSGERYEAEYRIVLPSGQVRWISTHGGVEFNHEHKPILLRGVSHDITQRKESEQESLKLREQVVHAGRVSVMGQLASALAHEINQPLGAILRNAEAAELFMQGDSPDYDEVRAILADIRKDDERAGNVISRMRGMLKQQVLDKKPINIGALVNEVVALVRSDTVARHINLEVVVAENLPQVAGDPVHLQQVLLNLIVNAMDALSDTPPVRRRVIVSVSVDAGESVQIDVRDSGKGIPDEKLTQIFEPFFTTKTNGIGMGLSISRTIIETHRGKIWAENSREGGAIFHIALPIAQE